jgi:hypothetical protein
MEIGPSWIASLTYDYRRALETSGKVLREIISDESDWKIFLVDWY